MRELRRVNYAPDRAEGQERESDTIPNHHDIGLV